MRETVGRQSVGRNQKRWMSPGAFLLLASGMALPGCQEAEAPPAGAAADVEEASYAIVGATVIPMDGQAERLDDRTVLVRDDRIAQVGPAGEVEVPDGAEVIDGEDRYLIPGLAEMHAHLPGENADPQWVDDVLFLYLANGVTTIRSMQGAPHHLELRADVAEGRRPGPTIFSAAPSMSGGSVDGPDHAAQRVREHAAAGYDLLKTHWGLTTEEWDAMAEAAREGGIPFAGHIPQEVGLEHALETGISTVEHLDGYINAMADPDTRDRLLAGESLSLEERMAAVQEERLPELVEATVDAGAWNAPTLYVWENLWGGVDGDTMAALPEMEYMPPEMLEGWVSMSERRSAPDAETAELHAQVRKYLLSALNEAGAGILMAIDSPQMFNVPGFSLHREVALMEEAGLSRYDIVETGTRNVARYVEEDLGGDGDFGTVVEGNRADLVLLEEDPLEDLEHLRHVAGVMARGEWLSGAEIQERLEAMAERRAADR